MIRDLLKPESQDDPYVWAAVFVAHFGIGAMLWAAAASLLAFRAESYAVIEVAAGAALVAAVVAFVSYAAFEAFQAWHSGDGMWMDSVLDCVGAALGVTMTGYVSTGHSTAALACAGSAVIVAAVGAVVRARHG